MTDYFINFAPADAVQYDGTNAREVAALYGLDNLEHSNSAWITLLCEAYGLNITPGQWLVRQGSRVWVQDEEPARVERWQYGARNNPSDIYPLKASSEQQAREWKESIINSRPNAKVVQRAHLSNGWTGPWLLVEGGAE